jgi:sialic acid synthase SpsE
MLHLAKLLLVGDCAMSKIKLIKVGNHQIGSGRTFIVAEIGSNHGQNIQKAFELIDTAKECGADAVKFQSLKVDELYYKPPLSIQKLHKQIDMDEQWYSALKEYADKKKVIFFSSPAYLRAVDILEGMNVQLYKLASAQIANFPQLIKKVAEKGKPVLLSSGLVSYGQLERAINFFREAGNDDYAILHCNSIYPTPHEKVNLPMIPIYRKMFGKPVGFSDHTIGIEISVAAVALGAKVIERHFILNKNDKTPDTSVSIDPNEFKRMVASIRAVEKALIERAREEIEEEEERFRETIIYRLILKNDKKKGDTLVFDDFEFKRFHRGINCWDLNEIVENFILKVELRKGSVLTMGNLENKHSVNNKLGFKA